MSNIEKLEAEIAEAYCRNEEHAEASDKAEEEYQRAVAAGDMEAADKHKAEAEAQERMARTYADRIEALEAKREEAARKDHKPAMGKAVKEAEAAAKAEAETHAELAELIRQLNELRGRIDATHEEANRTARNAARLADKAHCPKPDIRRSRMSQVVAVGELMHLGRELGNVAAFQDQRITELRRVA